MTLANPAGLDPPRHPQRPRECPPALRFLEASLAGMQVSAPARPSRRRIGNDLVPGCHQAKQVGLGRTGSASHTGPDRWRVPDRARIPRDHLRQAYSAYASGAPRTVPSAPGTSLTALASAPSALLPPPPPPPPAPPSPTPPP